VRRTFVGRSTPLPQQVPLGLTHRFGQDPGKQTQWRAFLQRNELAEYGCRKWCHKSAKD
jgi:hypothetical protein